ncbi:MAG TPA: glycosyltransferase family 4 protein [Ktedonobacterales bacterium]
MSQGGTTRSLDAGAPFTLAGAPLSGAGHPRILTRPPLAIVSSFPPRECGIATFARDLMNALEHPHVLGNFSRLTSPAPWVIAMNEAGQSYSYGPRVRATIDRDEYSQYLEAAALLNAHPRVQLVSLQHEYGLYGGEYGSYILDFIRAVRLPVVTTMHTVLERPDPALRQVTEQLINSSAAVVVLARTARELIERYYPRADLSKVAFIPHGTPSVRREPTARYKRELDLDGYTVLSTFGLLGPDKGIEYAIRALPAVVAHHPDALYLVLGQTHPGQRRHAGESYRDMLTALVDELGMRDHVRFYNRYLSMKELLRFLQATDVYVMPYLNPQQIVSGTLAYAVACGKTVVATPFTYAREMLGEGRGMLAEFRDAASIGTAVNQVLDDPALKEQVEQRAYNHGLRMHWPAVGVAYCRLYQRVVDRHHSELRARRAQYRRLMIVQGRRTASAALAAGMGIVGLTLPDPAAKRVATARATASAATVGPHTVAAKRVTDARPFVARGGTTPRRLGPPKPRPPRLGDDKRLSTPLA